LREDIELVVVAVQRVEHGVFAIARLGERAPVRLAVIDGDAIVGDQGRELG